MLFAAFIVKHFICDFLLQRPYHYLNKGKYGHPGGVNHALIHAVGTFIICYCFGLPLWFAAVDGVVHYHIDWTKTQITTRYKLTTKDTYFWWLVGLDQTLHLLTYAWFIAYV